jgi:protein-S-isoprenylcysteine O-methyltransferase Ste14
MGTMKPLAYTSPSCWLFWAVYLLAFVPEFTLVSRSRPARGETVDRGSMAFIMLAGWVGMMGAFAVAGVQRFAILHGRNIWFLAGLTMLLCGSLLRRHCWRMLGAHFTGDVKASADQPVIQRGIYRWVRHPSYTGGMMMYLGTGLALTNWLSALIISVSGGLAYVYRVRVEEQALQANLGARYQEYMQRTKRFIPFVV